MARRSTAAEAPRARRAVDTRIEHQPAFVLHATPWRETSLIVDVLSRDHGRLPLVARGAKRPTSQFRGLLAPFGSLALSWSGRGEVRTLVRADWLGTLVPLRGEALLAAFYVNELVVRLLARDDPHPVLFGRYIETLASLARATADGPPLDAVLRGFELDLLREAGHAPDWTVDEGDVQVEADARYRLDPERGPVRLAGGNMAESRGDPALVDGTVLLALARRDFNDAALRAPMRDVLRHLIRYHLHGRPLNTRRIFQDLKAF